MCGLSTNPVGYADDMLTSTLIIIDMDKDFKIGI